VSKLLLQQGQPRPAARPVVVCTHVFLLYRTENIFKQLDERSLTEEEERIIQQRVSAAGVHGSRGSSSSTSATLSCPKVVKCNEATQVCAGVTAGGAAAQAATRV
jgi:hypothetical protein